MNDPFARGGPSFIPPSLKTSKRGRPYTNDPATVIQQQSVIATSTEALSSSRNQLTLQQQQNRNRNTPFYSSEAKGTSQETVKFNRNRFHPLSSTKAPITLTTTRTTLTTPIPSSTTPSIPPSSTEANDSDSNRSRLAALTNRFNIRGQNSSNNRSNKLLRQPLYTSRESNTPIGIVNSSIKKINVTHNGSANRDASSSESSIIEATTSSSRVVNNPLLKLQQLQQQRNQQKPPAATVTESDPNTSANLVQSKENDNVPTKQASENDKGEKLYDDELEEYEDEDYENENDADAAVGYEEDEVEEIDEGARKQEEKSENKPVILTSNFFLPGVTTTPAAEVVEPVNEEKVENETQVVDNDKTTDVEGGSDAADVQAKAAKEGFVDVASAPVEEKMKEKKTAEVASNPPDDIEYEYEYEYEDETTTPQIIAPTTKSSVTGAVTKQEIPVEETTASITDADYYETTTVASSNSNDNDMVVSVVTTKSIINGSTSTNTEESITKPSANESETIPTASPDPNELDTNSTESYVVVASVQTSRSISGARFLPFPQVEQEEKKQSLADLEKDERERNESTDDQAEDLSIYGENNEDEAATLTTARPDETTIISHENATTQETATDKLTEIVTSPRVHKWSSVSEKLAHLHEKIDNVEVTTKGIPVVIRKFMPRTTKVPHKSDGAGAKIESNSQQNDESTANLPPGFKFRPNSSYKNGKITTSTTTSTTTEASANEPETVEGVPVVEIKNKIQFKEIALDDLLPKDYKPSPAADSSDSDDILTKLLPSNFKNLAQATTKAPLRFSTVTEDVSKFLPPGFKPKESTSKRPLSDVTIVDDISAFLPPGFKLPKSTTIAPKPATILDDISKFLPPGFKVPSTSAASEPKTEAPKIALSDDLNKFLPPGFKLNATDGESTSNAASKTNVSTADISSLLPPGFSLNKSAATSDAPPSSSSPSFKIVFPKGIGKRPGFGRVTTPRPSHVEGPPPPGITIRKGLPTRLVKVLQKPSMSISE